jgi:hypothetical protein
VAGFSLPCRLVVRDGDTARPVGVEWCHFTSSMNGLSKGGVVLFNVDDH